MCRFIRLCTPIIACNNSISCQNFTAVIVPNIVLAYKSSQLKLRLKNCDELAQQAHKYRKILMTTKTRDSSP